VVKEAKRRKRSEGDAASIRLPAEVSGLDLAAPKPKNRPKSVDRAIARATQEVVEPSGGAGRRRRRGGQPPAEPVNEPLPFITFIAAHPLGSEVIGAPSEYSSHGAFVEADGAKCYIPLSAMGDPPPRRAREVVSKGQPVTFVVQAFDPQRRGIELALPGFAQIAGGPTPETVDAEIHPDAVERPRRRSRAAKTAAGRAGAEPAAVGAGGTDGPGSEQAGAGDDAAAPKKPRGKPAVLSVSKPPAEPGAASPEVPAEERVKKARKTKQQAPAPRQQAGEPVELPKAAGPVEPVKVAGRTEPAKAAGRTEPAKAPGSVEPQRATGPAPPAKTAGSVEPQRATGPAPPAKTAKRAGKTRAAPSPGPGDGQSAGLAPAASPGDQPGVGEQPEPAAPEPAAPPAKRARKSRAAAPAAPVPDITPGPDVARPAPG
jgi:hypothetical protein